MGMRAAISLAIAIIVSMALIARVGAAEPASELTARYVVIGTNTNGDLYRGEALLAPRGEAYEIKWYFPHGQKSSGFGIRVDRVFAAVRSFNEGSLPGTNVVAYRIAGGELTGIRLSGMNTDGRTGREVLRGSPDLAGRYHIVTSTNPYGASVHSGHVEITRSGNIYSLVWYTPEQTYFGSGLRIGDLLVVGYRRGRSPGVVAYCIKDATLQGSWVDDGGLGQETLQVVRTGPPQPLNCR